MSSRHLKCKRPTPQQTQVETCSTSASSNAPFTLFHLSISNTFNMNKRMYFLTQSQTGEDTTVEKPADGREEKLHYEEVGFLQRRLGASSMSAQVSRQQETVYSQVKVSVATAEDLWAQVKEIWHVLCQKAWLFVHRRFWLVDFGQSAVGESFKPTGLMILS